MAGESFGETVRHRRQLAGLTQNRLAELVGRSASAVRAWENGSSRPADAETVSAVAAVLGVDEGELLEKAGYQAPEDAPTQTLSDAFATLAPDTPTTPSKIRSLPPVSAIVAVKAPEHVSPSYVEIPFEARNYRRRALITALGLGILIIVLVWSIREAGDAIGLLWEDVFGQLDF